jgi:L-alanine-DL-glutamate epimerase-like enolase superfamily enzyme
LFIRLTTDTRLSAIGEASLEWQEKTVETLCHEWVKDSVLSCVPFSIEAMVGGLIRYRYQGRAPVMTAISGTENALWTFSARPAARRSNSMPSALPGEISHLSRPKPPYARPLGRGRG